MRKLELLALIRGKRPYANHMQSAHKYSNLLKRKFEQTSPNRFRVTDITYIHTVQGMVCVCAAVDLCGRVVLSYKVGKDMTATLVTDTVHAAQKQKRSLMD